jgi:hypothetical protein
MVVGHDVLIELDVEALRQQDLTHKNLAGHVPGRYKQLVRPKVNANFHGFGDYSPNSDRTFLGSLAATSFQHDPVIARHVGGWCPIEGDYGEHLPGDPEQQVVAPLHTFGRMRKREAVAPDSLGVHYQNRRRRKISTKEI